MQRGGGGGGWEKGRKFTQTVSSSLVVQVILHDTTLHYRRRLGRGIKHNILVILQTKLRKRGRFFCECAFTSAGHYANIHDRVVVVARSTKMS